MPGEGKDCWGSRLVRAAGPEKLDRAGDFLNLLRCDRAGAVDDHRGWGGVEDSGFDAVRGGAGVEDGVDAAVEVVEDVRGGGGAGVAEEIGAGRGNRDPGAADQGQAPPDARACARPPAAGRR